MDNNAVAPHAGAWIETPIQFLTAHRSSVAPHAGAWIETHYSQLMPMGLEVAPHAGAWIETQVGLIGERADASLPTRERGLKHQSN